MENTKKINEYSNKELLKELSIAIDKKVKKNIYKETKKKLYYISAEFLMGKMLINNLINLGIYDEAEAFFRHHGKSLHEIEEAEPEPSLGNGGLGRLASCFLDSIANLGLSGDGIGLNYHYGLFRQVFKDNQQTEEPNPWLNENVFLKKTNTCYNICFKDFTVKSRLYVMDIIGENTTNKLSLFDIESIDETIIRHGIDFDKTNIVKNLTLFLYPDDSDEEGKLLRVYQQYFMVSSAAKLTVDECIKKGSNLFDLHEYAVIQINDTHPSLIIPELIRILIKNNVPINDAIEIVNKTCAYTNHTILAEALEKWPVSYLEAVAPQLIPIIEILDNKVRRKYKDSSLYIIDENEKVHMAHLDIHYSFSVNGVAKLHTEILKNSELNNFYKIYPHKFNNKTNGITFRRWLLKCNPDLSRFITELIGDKYIKDSLELKNLEKYINDESVLNKLIDIKNSNKLRLKKYLADTQGKQINETTIYDMQIKRLHEYKRQQMNALYIINKYLEIKQGKTPPHPVTVIFGAKASPAYTIAKDIIHLILCLSEIVRNDKEVKKHLDIVMVENYNVTSAEMLIPACDISEQISLSSKEASGTSNMKFILNGAVILGTEDGANVEIHNMVKDDNIYIFGEDSKTVINRYKEKNYSARKYYEEDKKIKSAVDFITGKQMLSVGNENNLKRLQNELINKDWFMTFPDFEDYSKVKDLALKDYTDRLSWARKMLTNIANAGYFSSDRTITEYNNEIWKL